MPSPDLRKSHIPDMHAQLLEQVRGLPLAEQIELVDEFMEGSPVRPKHTTQLSPWQEDELKRRIEEFDADPDSAVTWEGVKADVEKEFGWKL